MKNKTIRIDRDLNPVSYYNDNCLEDAKKILLDDKNITMTEDGRMVETFYAKEIAEIKMLNGKFITEDSSNIFRAEVMYDPFTILTKFRFKGNQKASMAWVRFNYISKDIDYIRIGTNYFKKIIKTDRFNVERVELKRWDRSTIIDDYGKWILPHIQSFDDFTLSPSNINYQPVVGNNYNLYHPFTHKPKKGDWKSIEYMLRHIFGDQYDLGLIYLQTLYLHPKQALPILVLASKERSTGKTTFLNFLAMLFSQNMNVISPQDVEGVFNGQYALKNIIAIEETSSDKKHLVEKLKALSTGKLISVNQKYIDGYTIPFFGKFIITSNDTEMFLRIDSPEIRFWIRELGSIPEDAFNANIEDTFLEEIPAFLYHLETMPEVDFSKSRMVFTPEQIRTTSLDRVKANSMSNLFKELCIHFEELFDEDPSRLLEFTSKDVKREFFSRDNSISLNYIRKVLKEDFNLHPSDDSVYYTPFRDSDEAYKSGQFPINHMPSGRRGRIYKMSRAKFVTKFNAKNL